mgnify:CR=1 FL=1
MVKIYKNILLVGITSLVLAIFYVFLKQSIVKLNTESFIENANVLNQFVTVSQVKENYLFSFMIVLLFGFIFFFILPFLVHLYEKKISFINYFNLFASNSIFLIICIVFSMICLKISIFLSYLCLIFGLFIYLYFIYNKLKNCFSNKQIIFIFSMILFLIFLILLFIYLFV